MARFGAREISALAGAAAAAVIAVGANVFVARHYHRWDWTSDHRYTLSEATLGTLRELSAPVEIWILVGANEPILVPIRELLVAYEAESPRLTVRYVDPDKDVALLEEVRQRFKIEAGRTESGRVVTDAIIVVASEGRSWFLGPEDLIEVSDATAMKVRPREEQALTHALRQVHKGDKARVCFTFGHGEASVADAGERGLARLRDILEKDNYEVTSLETTKPDAFAPYDGCAVVVIAGPRAPFTPDEENRLRTYLLEGGNLFAALGPVPSTDGEGIASTGLGRALAPFGIAADDAIVFETDRARTLPESHGAVSLPEVKEHTVTAALVRHDERHDPPKVILELPRPLRSTSEPGAAAALPLLVTSPDAFAASRLAGLEKTAGTPTKSPSDRSGPFVVAFASERPKTAPAATRGPRAVVVATASVLDGRNFSEPLPLRGAAYFAESAVAWLAARPVILDVPAKATVPAGLRISEQARDEVRIYVLVYLPIAVALLALAIGLRRRSTEGQR